MFGDRSASHVIEFTKLSVICRASCCHTFSAAIILHNLQLCLLSIALSLVQFLSSGPSLINVSMP